MAKVTVYVTDDQLERLKAARGVGRGGVSKAFQAFLESITSGEAPAGRYDYARKLMPLNGAIDRHRRRLARKVADGGPPADGGPVATALTLLVYRELLRRQPDLAATLEREFARFGLDELVAAETEGVDLSAEPEGDDAQVDIDEDDDSRPFGFGINIGDDLRGVTEAVRQVETLRNNLRAAKREARRGRPGVANPPRPPAAPTPPRPPRPGRHIQVSVGSDDDPRDSLTVTEFERFTRLHDDWTPGSRLTPSQMETISDMLRARAERDLGEDDGEGDD